MTALPDFEVIDESYVSEINTLAKLYLHKPTGAQVLSLENDDENKVFGITFRTPPSDSTGLPHIMEHSVLCGSQKYPLKKPFVELVRGSLNTFLNAMTFPDKTCYPVASQNTQDFYNLVDVYMDAVLHPLIQPHVLDQEGWHYELNDPDGEMSYKGVVFNEMKGAYSSPDSLLSEKSQQVLFPGHIYGEDSGGNPEEIPNLTYAQFKAFHETFYHPSNARIYFYGDDDPDERLRRIREYLRGFESIEVDSAVPLHTEPPENERVRYGYEVDEDNEQPKAYVSVNWRLAQATDVQLSLALSILSHILVGMSASPLRKALIDSGLGEGLVGRGVDSGLRQMIFSTGLKGVSLENVNAVEELILETLDNLSTNDIDNDTIAASMNTIEFRLRENNTGSFPRGLLMMFRALNTWLYDSNPIAPLAFEKPLNAIKARLESGDRFFEDLIKEYLIENPNRSVVILEPDPELRQRRQADEKSRLQRARRGMSPEQIQAVVENTRQLNLRQETPDPPEILNTLPSLGLEDLDRESKNIPNEIGEIAQTRLYYHDLFTNGIAYLDIGFDLLRLPETLLSYIPLFGRALLEMGTQSEDYVHLVQRIGRATGGLYTTRYTSHVRDRQESTAWLFLRGKGTMNQLPDLLAILKDILLTATLNNPDRFLQIVLEEKASQEARLIPGGHAVVNTRMRARYDQAGWMAERMGGIEYLIFLRKLESRIKQDWSAVLEDLQTIQSLLINRPGMIVNITLDGEGWKDLQPRLLDFLTRLPGEVVPQVSWKAPPLPSLEGLTIPSQVNYVAKGADLFRAGYSLDGSALVVKNFLRTSWLWDSIRVRGGAYGAFSVLDQRSGVWTFLSYRDPNLHETLNNFDLSVKFLRELELSQEELVKSIIGVIGDLDAYLLPDAKGYTAMLRHLAGDSDEFRQELRNQVLETKASDFHRFAEVLDAALKDADVVVLGSQSALETAGNINGHALQIQKVL